MRNAGSAKHIPVHPINRVLVAHHQRGDQAGKLALLHRAKDALAHALADQRHRVLPGLRQALGHRVARGGPHIAGGLHALLPQPQLVVKAVRVAAAVRRFEAQGHAPALAGFHVGGLALQGQGIRPIRKQTTVPAHIHQRWHGHRRTVQLRCLHRQAKTQTRLIALRQGRDHAGNVHIASLQRRVQRVVQKKGGA